MIVVAAAIAISSGGGSNATGLQKGKAATKTATAVQTLLAGIPQSGARLGNPKAPVTMTYYGDLECPICQDFTLNGGFPQLVSQGRQAPARCRSSTGRSRPPPRTPRVFKTQQVAALAAGQQQQFWDFTELFYHEQGAEGSGYVNDSYLSGLAKQITGLNLSKWQSRPQQLRPWPTRSPPTSRRAAAAGVQGTPTLVFQGPKGKRPAIGSSVPSYPQLQQAIKQVA